MLVTVNLTVNKDLSEDEQTFGRKLGQRLAWVPYCRGGVRWAGESQGPETVR